MRTLTFAMNVSLDGFIAAPGDDIGWSAPSEELFSWWSDQVDSSAVALYGRKLWQTMSPYWDTVDQQPDVSPAELDFARRWGATEKVVFSTTLDPGTPLLGNARLVTQDALAEITRLKAQDGPAMEIGGATLAATAMRAGLIDEYTLVTHPVLVGAGTPFFSPLEGWVGLDLIQTRRFPGGVLMSRYTTRR